MIHMSAPPPEGRGTGRHQQRRHDDQPAEEEQPVRQHVQPGEGDIGGADLQRHDLVGEPGEGRGREEKQHDRAVQREQLVELFVVHDLQARPGQFGPHHQGHQTGRQEEQERRDQVEMADLLVVRGGQPVDHQPTRPPAPPYGSCRRRYGLGPHRSPLRCRVPGP
jgi:hypothetical protein